MRTRGFTLIELLLVVVIMTLVTALAAPGFRGTFRAMALEETARSFERTLLFARERSILEGRRHRIFLDSEDGVYSVSVQSGEGYLPLRDRVGRRRYLPGGISMDSLETEVTFYPHGGGTLLSVEFTNEDGERRHVTVAALTGRVSQENPDEG